MTIPPFGLALVLLIIGFLSASTLYYFNKARLVEKKDQTNQEVVFDGQIPELKSSENVVDQVTQPADPRGRLSYPAHTYIIQPKENLYTISQKTKVPLAVIKQANSIVNENVIQAGTVIVIPKQNMQTDYYRVEFLLNEEKATELNLELREVESSPYFDPIIVAKTSAVKYFGLTEEDSFKLLEADLEKGTALIEATNQNRKNLIGLFQPKIKGEKGFWALLYIEQRR